jgi:mono/diheme cytochrome c family protein
MMILGCALAAAAGEPAAIERGRYLFNVADCSGCHSERDFTRFAGPVVPGGLGKGFVFPPELGLPGKVVASNITTDHDTGIGAWTDAEKIRAIRQGIGRDGRRLFPMMPSDSYSKMSDSDVKALVAYMNTLAPIRNPLPRTELPPGMELPPPEPAAAVPDPDPKDRVKYGEYLVTVAACAHCHGPAFEGGHEFKFPGGVSVTVPSLANSVKWTEDQFVKRFRMVPEKGPFTVMPWLPLKEMADEDLRAMQRYLKTAVGRQASTGTRH